MRERDLSYDEVLIRAREEMLKLGLPPPDGAAEQWLREYGRVALTKGAEDVWHWLCQCRGLA
jgi:hypothetical protein